MHVRWKNVAFYGSLHLLQLRRCAATSRAAFRYRSCKVWGLAMPLGDRRDLAYNVFDFFMLDELKYDGAVQPAYARRAVKKHMRDKGIRGEVDIVGKDHLKPLQATQHQHEPSGGVITLPRAVLCSIGTACTRTMRSGSAAPGTVQPSHPLHAT